MRRDFIGISSSVLVMIGLTGCSNLTSLFFYPQKTLVRTPAELELEYQTVSFTARDGVKLTSWWLPAQPGSTKRFTNSPTLLFLHGNAENISTHIGSVYWLPSEGVNVLMLDYRGYGLSEGEPLLPDVFYDVEAALNWIGQYHSDTDVYIFGQSIGATMAVTGLAMAESPPLINGVILDAGFNSFQAIAQHVTGGSVITFPLWPFTYLFPVEWDADKHIQSLNNIPILFFHSPNDEVIPIDYGRELFLVAKEPKKWVESEGGHIQTFNYQQYRKEMVDFIHHQKK